jgi:hypothetical protein
MKRFIFALTGLLIISGSVIGTLNADFRPVIEN